MPRSLRGATRRPAKRKPPLDVEALWAIRRIGTPTLSPDGVAGLQRGDPLRHGEERQQHVALAFPDRPRHRARRRAAATDAHRRRQGQRSQVVARRQVDRVHRQAQGRRGAAALPDRARRRRGAAAHAASRRAAPRRNGSPTASASPSSRGCGRTSRPMRCRRSAGRSARTRRSRRMSPSATNSVSGIIGSPMAASRTFYVCDVATGKCRDALARTRRRAAAVGALRRRLRHRARRPRDRDHRRSRHRAADDEPDRHRHRRSWPRAASAC